MTELTLSEFSRRGGKKTLEKYGKEHFSRIGKMKRKKKVIHLQEKQADDTIEERSSN